MLARDLRINWRAGTIGPGWFRRMRRAWWWYRSGDLTISQQDVEFAILYEREACAKLAEHYEPDEKTSYVTYASQDIRARSEMPSPPPNPTACGES